MVAAGQEELQRWHHCMHIEGLTCTRSEPLMCVPFCQQGPGRAQICTCAQAYCLGGMPVSQFVQKLYFLCRLVFSWVAAGQWRQAGLRCESKCAYRRVCTHVTTAVPGIELTVDPLACQCKALSQAELLQHVLPSPLHQPFNICMTQLMLLWLPQHKAIGWEAWHYAVWSEP